MFSVGSSDPRLNLGCRRLRISPLRDDIGEACYIAFKISARRRHASLDDIHKTLRTPVSFARSYMGAQPLDILIVPFRRSMRVARA